MKCILEGADENLLVATGFPYREAKKSSLLDEFPFGNVGLRIVIGDDNMRVLIVQVSKILS